MLGIAVLMQVNLNARCMLSLYCCRTRDLPWSLHAKLEPPIHVCILLGQVLTNEADKWLGLDGMMNLVKQIILSDWMALFQLLKSVGLLVGKNLTGEGILDWTKNLNILVGKMFLFGGQIIHLGEQVVHFWWEKNWQQFLPVEIYDKYQVGLKIVTQCNAKNLRRPYLYIG